MFIIWYIYWSDNSTAKFREAEDLKDKCILIPTLVSRYGSGWSVSKFTHEQILIRKEILTMPHLTFLHNTERRWFTFTSEQVHQYIAQPLKTKPTLSATSYLSFMACWQVAWIYITKELPYNEPYHWFIQLCAVYSDGQELFKVQLHPMPLTPQLPRIL